MVRTIDTRRISRRFIGHDSSPVRFSNRVYTQDSDCAALRPRSVDDNAELQDYSFFRIDVSGSLAPHTRSPSPNSERWGFWCTPGAGVGRKEAPAIKGEMIYAHHLRKHCFGCR